MNSSSQQRVERRRRLRRAVALRGPVYLIVLSLVFVFALRRFEFASTFHPIRYEAGQGWTLPPGGEDVWIKVGSSGERLHGWFVRSREDGEPPATILYAHGNGGNLSNVGWLAKNLTARGFDVLLFDYRGYGRSDGEVSDEDQFYEDAAAAYEYLVNERHVPPDKLVLYGQSLGTAAMIDVAARRHCRALIVESGLSSTSDMALAVLPWLPARLHFLSRNRFASAQKIAHVNCPVLITHGDPDTIIPAEQSRKLYAAAREPKRLVIIPGAGHNLSGTGGAMYFEMLEDFVRAAFDEPQKIRGELVIGEPTLFESPE